MGKVKLHIQHHSLLSRAASVFFSILIVVFIAFRSFHGKAASPFVPENASRCYRHLVVNTLHVSRCPVSPGGVIEIHFARRSRCTGITLPRVTDAARGKWFARHVLRQPCRFRFYFKQLLLLRCSTSTS